MAFECRYCAELSISALIELARKEFAGDTFPSRAYYLHHSSVDDLEDSADKGCSFCLLLVRCFKATPSDWNEMPPYHNNGSIYDLAKWLPISDIKISINSTHVCHGESLDLVRTFDTVMVQIGSKEYSPYSSEDDTGDWAFPHFPLTITTPRENPIYVEEYQIGRFLVDPDLASPVNFGIARHWLHTCLFEHRQCHLGQLPQLPTRVINVGSPNPYLMESKETKAQYVALSHCWGGAVSTTLTTETLTLFKSALPYSSLSANFRDAIKITKELGIQYLWIDSLCILQDSKPDWEHESKKMGTVYRYATVTISAQTSPRSSHGILKRNLTSSSPLGSAPLKVFPKDMDGAEVFVERQDPKEETLRLLQIGSPLSRRGWVLQETVLSPRVLYYGDKNIFWRCHKGVESVDGLPAGNRTHSTDVSEISAVFHDDNGSASRFEADNIAWVFKEYYKLVVQYSRRQLSVDSDKLPAFSGLSQLLEPTIDSAYLAGLWSRDINHGLLWHHQIGSCKHVQPYRAPSWSWAVTNQPVIYAGYQSKSSSLDLRLMEHSIVPRDGTNRFGELISAHITVNGFTMPFVRSKQIIHSITPTGLIGSCYFDESDEDFQERAIGPVGIFLLSYDTNHILLSAGMLGGGSECNWEVDYDMHSPVPYTALLVKFNAAETWERRSVQGLILRKASNQSGNAERVGYFTLHDDYARDLVLRLETCTRQTLVLV